MNERFGLHAVVHVHTQLQQAVIQGEEHGMSCAVRCIAGAPFGCSAKGAGVNEASVFGFFLCLKGLASLKVGMFARFHAVPGHAKIGHLAHGYGRSVCKNAGHFLVAAPVGTFNGIHKMHVGAVAFAHDGVAEGRLHPPLRRR